MARTGPALSPREGSRNDRGVFLAALEYGVSPVVPWWCDEPKEEEQ